MKNGNKGCQDCEQLQSDILETSRQLEIVTAQRNYFRKMLERCEMWLSTHPEGRKMQLECQRVLESKP